MLEANRALLESFTGNVFHVGDRAGQGQAMKLANNFLSATALAATSEAVAFGVAHGLDMATMIDVLNVSTGRNSATTDKFPNRILTGSYDAGFSTAHMTKDVGLFVDGAGEVKTAATCRLRRHRDMARLRRRPARQRLHRDLAVRLDTPMRERSGRVSRVSRGGT